MRRPVQILALLLMLPAIGVATASAEAAPKVPLAATLASCKLAKDADGGRAVFVGSMPAIAAATRMEMRFELLVARPSSDPTADAGYSAVVVPALNKWIRSDPGRAGLVWRKNLGKLVGPGAYRARITFRWRSAAGKVVRVVRRTTPACRQPDLRPNLVPVQVTAAQTAADRAVYSVVVRNTGRSAAGAFTTQLTSPGVDPVSDAVPELAARTRTVVLLQGAPCAPGTTLDLSVDPAGAVDEADETDNAITVACPLTAGKA